MMNISKILEKLEKEGNLRGMDLKGVDLRRVNFRGEDLREADLRGVNLSETRLSRANLSKANLSGANLREATLFEANLTGANFTGADLRKAYLNRATLTGVDCRGTNFWLADLNKADLRGADLRGANLSETDFTKANLTGANFTDTVLDPRNTIIDATEELITAGLIIKGGIVYGYRTKRSMICGNIVYAPGRYEAPVFSTCPKTQCHPGIYFAAKPWLIKNFGDEVELVKVASYVRCVMAVRDKFRTKELWVL